MPSSIKNRHPLRGKFSVGADHIEEGFLVFLKSFVVGQGQALIHRQQALEMAEHPPGLARTSSRHIGFFFCGIRLPAGGRNGRWSARS